MLVGWSLAIDPADGFLAQVEPDIERQGHIANPHVASQVGQAVDVAWLVGSALDVVEVPIDGFEMPRMFVLAGNRIVQADANVVEGTRGTSPGHRFAHQKRPHRLTQFPRRPGGNPQSIGHVRWIDALDKLALQGRQRFVAVADQQGVD